MVEIFILEFIGRNFYNLLVKIFILVLVEIFILEFIGRNFYFGIYWSKFLFWNLLVERFYFPYFAQFCFLLIVFFVSITLSRQGNQGINFISFIRRIYIFIFDLHQLLYIFIVNFAIFYNDCEISLVFISQ